jgi:cob(I)alamin adenosyltransferase
MYDGLAGTEDETAILAIALGFRPRRSEAAMLGSKPDDLGAKEGMGRVTTKTGDDGYTGLLGPGRVPKYHRRPEAYGTLDEATSALGLARAQASDPLLQDRIYALQQDIYFLMAELATPPESYEKSPFKVTAEHVARLEALSEELKAQTEIGKEFIIPGTTVTGAALDLARTVVRRGERQVARLYHEGDVTNVEALRYLNRLSDLLFILARHEEQTWRAGRSQS